MKTNSALRILLNLTKVQSLLARRFDRLSIHGIGFNDFMILYLLAQPAAGKLRRTDLAEQTGLTASGITRMLLPLEKTGLIMREANARDARVSYVMLTEAGRQLLTDATVTAEALAREILPAANLKGSGALTSILALLGGNIT